MQEYKITKQTVVSVSVVVIIVSAAWLVAWNLRGSVKDNEDCLRRIGVLEEKNSPSRQEFNQAVTDFRDNVKAINEKLDRLQNLDKLIEQYIK